LLLRSRQRFAQCFNVGVFFAKGQVVYNVACSHALFIFIIP